MELKQLIVLVFIIAVIGLGVYRGIEAIIVKKTKNKSQ